MKKILPVVITFLAFAMIVQAQHIGRSQFVKESLNII